MTRRSSLTVAAAAVAVLAVVGGAAVLNATSGGSGDPASAGGTAGGTAGGAAGGAVGGGATAPMPTEPMPPARDQQPRPDRPLLLTAQSYELLAPDRLEVRYATGAPECYGTLGPVQVVESGPDVVVRLYVRPFTGVSDDPCPDIALVESTVVQLTAPLGDRTVVDGSSGHAVPRRHGSS